MYEYHVCELEYRSDPRSYKNYLSDGENKAWKTCKPHTHGAQEG